MKIVIDIPESDYELIKNDGVQSHIACADEAIRNGIVLCNGKVKRNCKDCVGNDLWYYAMCSECKNKSKFSRR